MWLFLSMLIANAGAPPVTTADTVIVVEAYRDIQVYISPITVVDRTIETSVEAIVDPDAAFTYSGSFWRNAKVPNGYNGWQPVTLGNRELKIYNRKTIEYVWPDCNYNRDPMECSYRNDHYYLETTVYVDDNQLVVKAVLYDSEAQVVGVSTQVNNKIIRWIKQQEITTAQQTQQIQIPAQQNSCGPGSCSSISSPVNSTAGNITKVYKPKEELPLKWEIPHRLTDNMIKIGRASCRERV